LVDQAGSVAATKRKGLETQARFKGKLENLDPQLRRASGFAFYKITVERPLRLNFQVTAERIVRLEQEKAFQALATSRKRGEAGQKEIKAGKDQQELILQVLDDFSDKKLFKNRKKFKYIWLP